MKFFLQIKEYIRKHRVNILVIFCIVAAVGIFYGTTVNNGFIHDDHGQVETNRYIQSWMYLPKVITGCIWESAVGDCKQTYYYRPLQSLSYLLTYTLSPKPWAFHLVNLICFSIAVFLAYMLIALLTGDFWLGVLTAGIFLIHPVNSEVVNWIATVPELLYTIFILAATVCYIFYRKTNRPKYLSWVCFAYTLAIFAKEPAVFLPFIFVTLDFMYFRVKINTFFQWKHIKTYVYCSTLFAVYLGLRFNALGGLGSDPNTHQTFFQHVYIFFDLFGAYLAKVFWPYPLNLFYPYHVHYGIGDGNLLMGVITCAMCVGLLLVSWVKRWRVVVFALVWYGVFLAPSLIFTSSIGENLFAERHVFASTIGFALILSFMLLRFSERSRRIAISAIILLSAIVIGSFMMISEHNRSWRSDESIYVDTLKKSPDADLIRYNLAYLYDQSGQVNKAREQYEIIIKRHTWRGIDKVYNNLGNMARKGGDYQSASRYFEQSLAINPLHVEAYNNLGAMSLEQGDILTSLTYLCQANRINPGFQAAGSNFDRLVDMIRGMDEKTFTILYQSLLTSGIFHPANDNSQLALQNENCGSANACLVTFSTRLPSNTFLFPFLFAGETNDGQIVRPRRMGTRTGTGDIILDIDKKWERVPIRFSFPTCDRTYYKATFGVKG